MKYAFNNVMLVDDDAVTNYVNQKTIEAYNFAGNVMVFSKPTEALRHLDQLSKDQMPEVLLLDHSMPGMDGVEFLQQAGELPFQLQDHCRIVILTGMLSSHRAQTLYHGQQILRCYTKPLIKSNLMWIEKEIKGPKALLEVA